MFSAAAAISHCRFRDEVRSCDRQGVRTLVDATGFFRPNEVAIAVELVEEHLAHGEACGYRFVFADLDASLVGYACYGRIPCTTASFDLYWIAVDPRWQGQGLGRKLLADVESQVQTAGGQRIYIDTSGKEQYAPTRAFYEQNGFQCEARLQDFYGPGDDRVIYSKSLATRRDL